MSGLFQLPYQWSDDETLTNEQLNEEFLSLLDNAVADQTEGYSTLNNVPNNVRMDSTVDPAPLGARSYASSVAGEIERLRYQIAAITGESKWWDAPATTIAAIYAALQGAGTTSTNQITSGAVTALGNPIALVSSATDNSVTLQCATTPLKVAINTVNYTFTTNTTITGLTAAPSSNNTAIAGGTVSSDTLLGGFGTVIPIGTVGSEITNRIGQYAMFKVVHSGVSEYFLAYIQSSTVLSRAYRGYFYDSASAPIFPVAMNSGDTITLMRLSYLFVKTDGTLDVTYNPLSYGAVAPPAPNSGDYWYDSANLIWKKYNGTSFADAAATIIGICAQDSTPKTIGTRTFEYFAVYSAVNSVYPEVIASGTQYQGDLWGQRISVAGVLQTFEKSLALWTTTGPFASGVTLQSSTDYWAYVTNTGEQLLDTVAPYDRQDDLQGYYHPYAPWRAVALLSTTSGSIFSFNIVLGQPSRPQGMYPNVPVSGSNSPIGLDKFGTSTASSGSFTTSNSTTGVIITNMTVTMKTRGRPVMVLLQGGTVGVSAGLATFTVKIDTVASATTAVLSVSSVPAGAISFVLPGIPAGNHTFDLWGVVNSGANTLSVTGCRLYVVEL